VATVSTGGDAGRAAGQRGRGGRVGRHYGIVRKVNALVVGGTRRGGRGAGTLWWRTKQLRQLRRDSDGGEAL
jgi:hypothetical protein